jgi:hypothetical protein
MAVIVNNWGIGRVHLLSIACHDGFLDSPFVLRLFDLKQDGIKAKWRRKDGNKRLRDPPQACSTEKIVYFRTHNKKNNGFLGRATHFALTCFGHNHRLRQLEGEYL